MLAACPSAAEAEPGDVLLDPAPLSVRTGAYSKFAEFQEELQTRLRLCSASATSTRDRVGSFGPVTAAAMSELATCDKAVASLVSRPPVLTVGLWQGIMGDVPAPDVAERADAMTLTFEATDFTDAPEWNFCQDNEEAPDARAEGALARGECRNETDPCSLLTWGPRGATAGQGREIQWILQRTLERSPATIERAFGAEAGNVRRYTHLPGPPADSCDGTSAVEHFMCAAWIDPVRRQAWQRGLLRLGDEPEVREVYRALYRGYLFDGEKLARYSRLWASLGIKPSEIDFAYFFDRATHIGGPPDEDAELAAELDGCIHKEKAANVHAAARRCLSLRHPHPSQPTDRIARDVAYYLNAYPPDGLSSDELDAYRGHIPIAADTTFGLSDERSYPVESHIDFSGSAAPPPSAGAELTAAEAACPLFIRAPQRKRQRSP